MECFKNETHESTTVVGGRCDFEQDARDGAVHHFYPFITAVGGADLRSLTVQDGCVHLTAGVDHVPRSAFGLRQSLRIHPGVDQRYSKVTFSINVTCTADRYNIGLGVSVGDGYLRVVFHPGMNQGLLRIEGTHEFARNQCLGFTPPQWEEVHGSPRGARGSRLAVTLTKQGDHSVTITDPRDGRSKTFEWQDGGLWPEDAPRSPSFGLYGGDLCGDGAAIYERFKAEFE